MPSASKMSKTASICASVGRSFGAPAITADVYLCSNASVSATAATWSGFSRRTSTPSRGCPAASCASRIPNSLAASRLEATLRGA